MKKIYLLFLITLISVTATYAQAGWVDYKVDNKISVKLPAEPKNVQEGTVIGMAKDSTVCVVTLVDFQKTAQLDSTALVPLLGTQEFADGIKTGMLGEMPGFTLGDVKIDKWKNFYSYTLSGGNAEKKLKIYTYMVCIGSHMYSLSAVMNENVSPKTKDDFFASLKLN